MLLTRRAMMAGLVLSGCATDARPGEVLILQSADRVPVRTVSYGSGSRAVVLVPGGHGVGETWHFQAQRLARSGLRVVVIDYRGRGPSQREPQNDEKAHLDVLGVIRQLKTDGAAQISVIGASWGGWAAGTAAIASPELVDRLVLLAHSPFDDPERLGGRKLFIVAAEDRDGTGRFRLNAIRDQYVRTPPPKKLVILDGAAHAQFLFLTPQGERVYDEIESFVSAD